MKEEAKNKSVKCAKHTEDKPDKKFSDRVINCYRFWHEIAMIEGNENLSNSLFGRLDRGNERNALLNYLMQLEKEKL